MFATVKQDKKSNTSSRTDKPSPLQVKFYTLKMRDEEASKLGETIDALMKQAESKSGVNKTPGCFAWISRIFGSKSYQRSSQYDSSELSSVAAQCSSTASSSSSASASESGAAKSLEVNSRIFGLAGVKKASDPAKMLEQAASVMRARIEQLEQRAAEQRSEAARLVKLGQKTAAMRSLKKAKQIEASVAANSASLDAVEQQVDMLAQAAVQKTLTSALETTSKTMQKDKKMVARAERAVDDAVEVRDMADDLNNAMSELANHNNTDFDDDDLQEELEAMLEGSLAVGGVDIEDEGEFAAEPEKKRLNGSAALSAVKLPSVPKRKMKEEKSGLLSDDGAAAHAVAVG